MAPPASPRDRRLRKALGITTPKANQQLDVALKTNEQLRNSYQQALELCDQAHVSMLTADELDFAIGQCPSNDFSAYADAEPNAVLDLGDLAFELTGRFPLAIPINELQSACQDLRKSNAEFEKLNGTLRGFTQNPVPTENPLSTDRRRLVDKQLAVLEEKREMLQQQIDDLTAKHRSTAAQWKDTIPQPNQKIGHIQEALEETLADFDHKLSKLDALQVEQSSSKGSGFQDNLRADARQRVIAIVDASVHACRASLNVVFFQARDTYMKSNKEQSLSAEQSEAIQPEIDAVLAEIRSLWEEILPVASMAAEKEYLAPILAIVNSETEDEETRSEAVSKYTSGVLVYMNDRLQALASRISTIVHHHHALSKVFESLKTIHSQNTEMLDNKQSTTTKSTVPSTVPSTSPLTPATQQILDSAAIPIDTSDESSDAMNRITSQLTRHIQSRNEKKQQLSSKLQLILETSAKADIGDARLGTGALYNAVTKDAEMDETADENDPGFWDFFIEHMVKTADGEVNQVAQQVRDLGLLDPSLDADPVTFVKAAHAQQSRRITHKLGEGCLEMGTDKPITCPHCLHLVDSADFIRKWGAH